MKPTKKYNGRSRIRMFNCDNREFMSQVDDNYYDLAICDPEYGLSMDNQTVRVKPNRPNTYLRANENQYKVSGWDNDMVSKESIDQVLRISSNQILWGANYYCKYIPDGFGWIFWDKQMGENNFSAGEFAFQSIQKRSAMFSHPSMRVQGTRIHPTEKPQSLYKWLLKNYAEPNQKIFDGWGGSMSIAIACWDLGFDLDIIELDPDYFNDAVKRFENHISQTQLF